MMKRKQNTERRSRCKDNQGMRVAQLLQMVFRVDREAVGDVVEGHDSGVAISIMRTASQQRQSMRRRLPVQR